MPTPLDTKSTPDQATEISPALVLLAEAGRSLKQPTLDALRNEVFDEIIRLGIFGKRYSELKEKLSVLEKDPSAKEEQTEIEEFRNEAYGQFLDVAYDRVNEMSERAGKKSAALESRINHLSTQTKELQEKFTRKLHDVFSNLPTRAKWKNARNIPETAQWIALPELEERLLECTQKARNSEEREKIHDLLEESRALQEHSALLKRKCQESREINEASMFILNALSGILTLRKQHPEASP